MTKFIYF